MKNIKVSNNVIRRLPRYLRKLDELMGNGVSRISSFELGQQLATAIMSLRCMTRSAAFSALTGAIMPSSSAPATSAMR